MTTVRDTQHVMRANLTANSQSDNANTSQQIATGRPFTTADYLALKAATRRACEAAGVLAAVAEHTRVDTSRLSRYGLPHNPDFVPLDVAMDLDALAGQSVLLKAWADLCGFELVPKTRAERQPINSLQSHLVPVAKELGEVVVELAQTKMDTPAAAARVEREVADAADVLADLARDCRAVRAGR